MINQLMDNYIPENILHRDKQMFEIRECFKVFKRLGFGSNLAVLGVTGSGKTTIIKKIIEEEDNSIYINCAETKTPHKTFKKICGSKAKTCSDMLEDTIKFLENDRKILVFDEIDKISGINELMNDLNVIYRKLQIPIIIVTLKQDIISNMPSDVRKTLFFERITLPSYNALELADILKSRIEMLDFKIPSLNNGRVQFISAMAAKQGSARVLMKAVVKCIQRNNFSEEFIRSIYEQIVREDCLDFVNDINETEKEFLVLLLRNCDWENEISSEEMGKGMKDNFTAARISQLANTFEKYSVTCSRYQYFGRGRTRLIKFESKQIYEEIKKILNIEV